MYIVLAVLCVTTGVLSESVVRVQHGLVKGVAQESTRGRSYVSFLGIPYARPPLGKYRFTAPQPLDPWPGVWDASRPGSQCLQYEPVQNLTTGNEDCLYLNVHTPRLSSGDLLPVMVYIHSGAFMFGAGHLYGPAHLMDKDVVVVSFNYRLGAFGFLSTSDQVVPGNAGLKDQAFLLRWVQDNIRQFGGDPDSVTLTGCSAGAAGVHYHYLSPLSKGTFHRGIAFSGSAFAPWAYAPKPVEKARSLASLVGCTTVNNGKMVECLRSRPGAMIVDAQIRMFQWKAHLFTPFTPTMEPTGTDGAFITEYPHLAALAGSMHRLPLITTQTTDEGLYPAAYYQRDDIMLREIEEKWDELASYIFQYNDTLPNHKHSDAARRIKQEYLGGKPVSQDTFSQLVEALSDRHFLVSIDQMTRTHARRSSQPTYMYSYNYSGAHSLSHILSGHVRNYGVSHADDIMEVFQFLWNSDADEDVKMRDTLIDIVYSFVSSGTPKTPNGVKWEPVNPESEQLDFLDISGPNKFEMKSKTDFGRKSFWDSLALKEYENYQSFRDEL